MMTMGFDVTNDIFAENAWYFSNKTKQHIHILYAEFGNDKFFGRTEVMNMLEITASPASELIKKMLESELICHIKGKGKGKYLFKRK